MGEEIEERSKPHSNGSQSFCSGQRPRMLHLPKEKGSSSRGGTWGSPTTSAIHRCSLRNTWEWQVDIILKANCLGPQASCGIT